MSLGEVCQCGHIGDVHTPECDQLCACGHAKKWHWGRLGPGGCEQLCGCTKFQPHALAHLNSACRSGLHDRCPAEAYVGHQDGEPRYLPCECDCHVSTTTPEAPPEKPYALLVEELEAVRNEAEKQGELAIHWKRIYDDCHATHEADGNARMAAEAALGKAQHALRAIASIESNPHEVAAKLVGARRLARETLDRLAALVVGLDERQESADTGDESEIRRSGGAS